jgi:hypothetical protein
MLQFFSTYTGQDESARTQFSRLSEVLTGELVVPLHNVAPTRPRIGRVVVADGVNWDPLTAGVPRLVWFNGTAWVALNA